MTHDELQAIKARHTEAAPDGIVDMDAKATHDLVAEDVPALIAEVERLQALVDALMNPKPGRDPRYYNEVGDYRDGKGNRFGQYCPNGKVQLEGLSAGRQFSPYSFEPCDSVHADVWVDGERYNFQAGDVETKPWHGYARGLHITTNSCDLVVQQTAINACSVFVKKKIMP